MQAKTDEPLFDFLVGWFVRHTTTEDRLIGEFVRNHAALRELASDS